VNGASKGIIRYDFLSAFHSNTDVVVMYVIETIRLPNHFRDFALSKIIKIQLNDIL